MENELPHSLSLFYLLGSLIFWIPTFLIVVLQVVLIIHVIRNHRQYYWIYLILFFPMVGAIVYFCIEVIPDLKNGRIRLPFFSHRRKRIRELEGMMLFADTTAVREELAKAYMETGQYDKAIPLFEYFLKDGISSDPKKAIQLVRAFLATEQYGKADKLLKDLNPDTVPDKSLRHDLALMTAIIHEEQEQHKAALDIYQELVKLFKGEEARFRYGYLLHRMGEREKAKVVFDEIITRSKHSPSFYVKAQKKWIRLARKYS